MEGRVPSLSHVQLVAATAGRRYEAQRIRKLKYGYGRRKETTEDINTKWEDNKSQRKTRLEYWMWDQGRQNVKYSLDEELALKMSRVATIGQWRKERSARPRAYVDRRAKEAPRQKFGHTSLSEDWANPRRRRNRTNAPLCSVIHRSKKQNALQKQNNPYY